MNTYHGRAFGKDITNTASFKKLRSEDVYSKPIFEYLDTDEYQRH